VRKKSTEAAQKRAVFEDMPVGASRRALHHSATANQEMLIFIGRGVPTILHDIVVGRREMPHQAVPAAPQSSVVDRAARIASRRAKTNINQATP
jgi:hypothetical protein